MLLRAFLCLAYLQNQGIFIRYVFQHIYLQVCYANHIHFAETQLCSASCRRAYEEKCRFGVQLLFMQILMIYRVVES